MLLQYQMLGKNFNFVILVTWGWLIESMTSKDLLQNVDEILSQPFSVNRVFNQILTKLQVGFILQPSF